MDAWEELRNPGRGPILAFTFAAALLGRSVAAGEETPAEYHRRADVALQSFLLKFWSQDLDYLELRPLETPFIRGDPNGDGGEDLSDGIALLFHLYLGSPPVLPCERSADTTSDGWLDVSDVLFILGHLFTGGPPPGDPFPACGLDAAPDLSCESYDPCL